MADDLPVIGAALPVSQLAAHRGWLLDKQRDVELQGFFIVQQLTTGLDDAVAEAQKQLEGHSGRLGIHGPFIGFGLDTFDPDVREIVRLRLDQGLEACARLGATQMVLHSPYTAWYHHNHTHFTGTAEAVTQACHDSMAAAVKRAEALGVTLVLENVEDLDPMARRVLAASFASPNVRVSLDTGHAHFAHASFGAPPLADFIAQAGDWLHHVHLQDGDRMGDRHWPPGRGEIDWPGTFAALRATGATPHLVLELSKTADIPAAMAFLEGQGLAQ